jgi:diguanylate cyclase (GGDEF)-like protein
MNALPKKIKYYTLLIILFVITVSWVIGYLFLEYELRISVNKEFHRMSDSTRGLFIINMKHESKDLENKLEKIISINGLSKAVADKNYDKIDSIVKPQYDNIQLLQKINILTFRSPDGITLYRAHKREFFGDKLNKKRKLIVDTNTFKRSLKGFEVGKLDTTFRITKPIFHNNKYVGSVELGISPIKFIKDLSSVFKVDIGIAIDKSLLNLMLNKTIIHKDGKYALVKGNNSLKKHFVHKHDIGEGTYQVDMSIPLKNHLEEVLGYLVVGYNISEIKQNNNEFMYHLFLMMICMTLVVAFVLHKSFNKVLDQFTKQAYTDPLTGLQNRQALNNLLQTKESNLLILSNIKEFSVVNELYGVNIGNKILVEIAEVFLKFSKKYNFNVYRISSDEYVLIKSETIFDADKFCKMIEEIQKSVGATKIKIDESDDFINVEIYSGLALSCDKSLMQAQMAIKKAREKSLPFLAYSKYLDTKNQSKNVINIKKTIKYALENKYVVPFFQPITNRDGNIIKYEALARIVEFDNGKKNILTPDKFLDISMKSDLYTKIAKDMIEQSLAFFANRDEKISINLLPNDFFNSSIMNALTNGLKGFGAPERVVIEIVEQESSDDFDKLLTMIEQLRRLGVQIAIDDFGSGYANYVYILKIKPNYIKIDGSLIQNILTNKESKILVKSIVLFAKELNIITIAEFVENKEIFELLKEYGVDEFQGYYFGRPTELV